MVVVSASVVMFVTHQATQTAKSANEYRKKNNSPSTANMQLPNIALADIVAGLAGTSTSGRLLRLSVFCDADLVTGAMVLLGSVK